MEVTDPSQIDAKRAGTAPQQWLIAFGGMALLILASYVYARLVGNGFLVFALPLVIGPFPALVHGLLDWGSRRRGWRISRIALMVWLAPTVYLIASGYHESRPAHLFENLVISPVPRSVSDLDGRSIFMIGSGFWFKCDSNAIATIVEAHRLQRNPNPYDTTSSIDAREVEELVNPLIAFHACRYGLASNYLREPLLFERPGTESNHATKLWVERDYRQAYLFLE
jgi:hypothetical protein